MTRFITVRLVMIIPIMFGVSFFVFILAHLAPGDVSITLTGPYATEETREKIREAYGLNESLPVQYGKWIGHIVQGDLGKSIANRRKVTDLIFPKFANSLSLALTSAALAYVIGLFVGIFAASRPYGFFDRFTIAGTLMFGSMPPYWFGLLLVLLFSLNWRLLPATGMTKIIDGGGPVDVILHLILPTIAASAAPAAIIARTVRATMLEVLSQNYIKLARAKGIHRGVILRKHALRNALPPIVTICGLQLGYLLGGVLFVEVIFAWPGIGYQLWQAIQARDIPTIQGASLIIGAAFVLVNLAVDVLNAYTDPKIRISEGVRSR
jgi:peptide/nickel transport system permease protein